jgi:hypothetical protein
MGVDGRRLLRRTFSHLVAVVYTGGTIAHVARLALRFGFEEMPFLPDWGVVLLGTPGVVGLVLYAGEVDYRGRWEVLVHWLIVAHLSVSVVLHVWILAVQTHEMLSIFTLEYSYFALAYFGFFAWRSWSMKLKPVALSPVADQDGA